MYTFPTREELMRKPLEAVRHLDIRTKEEEMLVQEVVNVRMSRIGVDSERIYRRDVPDIKTKEEEEFWQAKIDERMERAKAKPIEFENAEEARVSEEQVLEKITALEEERAQVEVTDNLTIPFCEYCDSKGIRHKKECARPQ